MKYAKILYLADVLEDIQNEMNRDYRCHSYAESVSGIVKDLRETVAGTSMPNEIECEKIEVKRIENSRKVNVMDFPRSESLNVELLQHNIALLSKASLRMHSYEQVYPLPVWLVPV